MYDHLLLSDILSDDLKANLRSLLDQQMGTWELLRRNYEQLERTEVRKITLDESTIHVQHNPARITSTTAQVDEESIRSRPCFLCAENLAKEQRGVKYGEDFIILCNPFPIFPEHFTVVHTEHSAQRIEQALPTLLGLSSDLGEEFVVLYNGPSCGASAPDHLHLQIGNSGFLPLMDEYERMISETGEKLADRGGFLAFAVENGGRRFVAFESDSYDELVKYCSALFDVLLDGTTQKDEPMVNILSWHQEGEWRIVVFPRAAHRPSIYFEEGEKKILVSPASIDLAGVLITPRAEDFRRITEEIVTKIYNDVLLSARNFESLKQRLVARYLAMQ